MGRTETALESVRRGLQLLDRTAGEVARFPGTHADFTEALEELLALRKSLSESPEHAARR